MDRKMSRGAGLAAGRALALCAALLCAPAAASASVEAERAVAARQAAMKELGAHSRHIAAFLRGGAAADMASRGRAVAAIAARLPGLFPEGSGLDALGLDKTGAKAAIWERWDAFQAASKTLATLGLALAAAAEDGDRAGIGGAMAALGRQGCGGCHRDFRQKRD